MRQAVGRGRAPQKPEVVLNLWAYADRAGNIVRLAGKAYVMDGEDEQKLELLRQLSATDFLSAPWHKVPERFSVVYPDGERLSGVAHVSLLSAPESHEHLFGSLMDLLAERLPEQMRSINAEYQRFRMHLPQAPLTVTTVVVEHEDGRLEPMVSS